MRDYFTSLGDSAHPNSSDPRARAITKFQELLLVSFREFSVITDEMILSERKKFRSEIIFSIESFAKRSAIRNLRTLGRFGKEQAGLIYDALYRWVSPVFVITVGGADYSLFYLWFVRAICLFPPPSVYSQPPKKKPSSSSIADPEKRALAAAESSTAAAAAGEDEGVEEKPETRIGLKTFQCFLSEIATWARDEKIVRNGLVVSVLIPGMSQVSACLCPTNFFTFSSRMVCLPK
jgi:TBC1 domain family member 8/9